MKKIWIVLLLSVLIFTGCQPSGVQTGSGDAIADENGETKTNNNSGSDTNKDNGNTKDGGTTNGGSDNKDDGTTSDDSGNKDDGQPEIENGILEPGRDFISGALTFSCLGAKEYKSVKSDAYTDKPDKGKVYLVMFLNVANDSEEGPYFSPEGLTASVDGEEISHSFLVNDPEGYETMFGNLPGKGEKSGFIVWQVPKNWEKLEYTYTGLEFSNHLSFSGTLTKDSLSEPPEVEEK